MKIKKQKISRWTIAAAFVAMQICLPTMKAFSAPALSGADTFKVKCAMCHGQDGGGSTPMGQRLKIRDLRSADVQKQTDGDFSGIISNGKAPMPAYAKSLGPDSIQQLVTYLRSIAAKN